MRTVTDDDVAFERAHHACSDAERAVVAEARALYDPTSDGAAGESSSSLAPGASSSVAPAASSPVAPGASSSLAPAASSSVAPGASSSVAQGASSSIAQGTPSLVAPPFAEDLLAAKHRGVGPLRGTLAHLVGKAVAPRELTSGDETLAPRTAAHVRAWPLPSLVGRVVVVVDRAQLPGALHAVMREALGDVPLRIESRSFGGPGKYLHVHTSVTAPPDGDVPMAIELYGKIVALGALDTWSDEGARFLAERRARAGSDVDTTGADLPTPWYVVVRAATYANIMYPGVDVPFYM